MDNALAAKLADYHPTDAVKKLVRETPILLLVGPTGAGKDSVKDKLLATGRFHHIISHTTRRPRINHGVAEQDGREYHFVDTATAGRMLDNHEFIEAKQYSDNLYGTSLAEIRAAHDDNKVAMTDIEVQGVAEYKALDPGVKAVFLLPPDFQTWQKRLQYRYGEVVDAADYRLRVKTALHELEELLSTDYYVAIINDDLDQAVAQIQAVIKNDSAIDETAARQVAEKLVQDIQAYLARTA